MATRTHRLERFQTIPRERDEVFEFFADAANLERLTPPFLCFRILTALPIPMLSGTRIEYFIRLFGLPFNWRTLITRWEPGVSFVDEQESGPYALWRHTHRFESHGGKTIMHDLVEYAEPFGPLGTVAHGLVVKRTLDRIFDFRRDATSRLLGPDAITAPDELNLLRQRPANDVI
jgi:ligand-binding SRPBCC domain-containing protein